MATIPTYEDERSDEQVRAEFEAQFGYGMAQRCEAGRYIRRLHRHIEAQDKRIAEMEGQREELTIRCGEANLRSKRLTDATAARLAEIEDKADRRWALVVALADAVSDHDNGRGTYTPVMGAWQSIVNERV